MKIEKLQVEAVRIKVEPRANGSVLLRVWAGVAEFPSASPKPMSPPRRAKYPSMYRSDSPSIWVVVGMEGLLRAYQSSGRVSFANRCPTMCDAAGYLARMSCE